MGVEQLEVLRKVLQDDSWAQLNSSWNLKWHFMAIRRTPYIDTDRIGIEFRIYHGAQGRTPTVEIIRKTLGLIGHPEKKFDLGGSKNHGTKPYSISQLRDLGLVPGIKVLDAGLPKELVLFLKQAANAASFEHLPDMTIHSGQDQLLVRWSVPFLDWKSHPAVPKDLHQSIELARQELIKKLQTIQTTQPIPTKETQREIQKAIAEWARATQLWRYF